MAQASTPSVDSKFDVFLSFRGKDTRKRFVGHLFERLTNAQVNVFLDNKKLKKGEDIGFGLEEAIKNSAIYVPIFSKHYANSPWCLDEISHMVHSSGIKEHQTNGRSEEKIIIPIFYDVKPFQVRHQKDPFEVAFKEHQRKGRFSEDKIQEWKKALKIACDFSGWDLEEDCAGHEAKLVKLVTLEILSKLPQTLQDVAKIPVGLNERTLEVIKLLHMDSDAMVMTVGICGIGGIGKTTLARSVFNEIHSKFIGNSVWLELLPSTKITELQKEVIKRLVNLDLQIDSIAQGKNLIKKHLRGRKVLVVLDGYDHHKGLEIFRGDWWGAGSRIIVTTRNEGVLDKNCGDRVYHVEELRNDEALELFCQHAFSRPLPDVEYTHLTDMVVKACQGLPLTLEVIGGLLQDEREEKMWLEALKQLRSVELEGIEERLMISYKALNDTEKAIFLDVACFFIGSEKDKALSIWEASGLCANLAIRNLQYKSLIKLIPDGLLGMHDILRDMGRRIVRKENTLTPGKRSRLWDEKEVQKVLKGIMGSNTVEGVLYNCEKSELLSTNYFEPMQNLRLLSLSNIAILDGDYRKLSAQLRWLRWAHCPLECLPPELEMDDMAVLELTDGQIKQVWDEQLQARIRYPTKLKFLNLSKSVLLEKLPEFSLLPFLESVELNGCERLARVPDSIEILTKLKLLDLSYCKNVKELPESIGNLTSLEKLLLTDCKSLVQLPKCLRNLTSLKELELDHCSIIAIPDSFGDLFSLRKLRLGNCRSLRNLPKSIGALKRLQFLDMNASGVASLPEEFGRLFGLEELSLSDCLELVELPQSFGNLSSLRVLKLNNNPKLTKLPASLSHLKELRILEAGNCGLLEDGIPAQIGMLTSLEVMNLHSNRFRTLPESFKDFLRLGRLILHQCSELLELPILPGSLVELDLHSCSELRRVSDLSNLKRLKTLVLSECQQLAVLVGVRSLQSLAHLNITGCQNIQAGTAEDLCELKSLETLYMSGTSVSVLNFHKGMFALCELVFHASAIPELLDYQMETEVLGDVFGNRSFMEVDVTVEKNIRCTGVIFCFISHDQGWLGGLSRYVNSTSIEASITRCGIEVLRTQITHNRDADGRDELHLFICRENHSFVKNLRSGDRIHVWARSLYPGYRIWVKQGGLHLLYSKEGTQPVENSDEVYYRQLFRDLRWLQCRHEAWNSMPMNLNMNFLLALDLANCFIDQQTADFTCSSPWENRLGFMRVAHMVRKKSDMRLKTEEWFELEEEELFRHEGWHVLGWTSESGEETRIVWSQRSHLGRDVAMIGFGKERELDIIAGDAWLNCRSRNRAKVCLAEWGVSVRNLRGDVKVTKHLIRSFGNAPFVQMDGWNNEEWCCRFVVPLQTQFSLSARRAELMSHNSNFLQKVTMDFPVLVEPHTIERENGNWTNRAQRVFRISVARGSQYDVKDHFFFFAKFIHSPSEVDTESGAPAQGMNNNESESGAPAQGMNNNESESGPSAQGKFERLLAKFLEFVCGRSEYPTS